MWLYENKEVSDEIEEYIGFVYLITNLESGKKYIGKKLFKSIRTKKVKGKTRRKKVKTESDWKTYFGSNAALLEDVERLGQNRFKREILKLCRTKGECTYYEAKLQFQYDVLLSDEYYNSWIMCRVRGEHLPRQNDASNKSDTLNT